jgi:hypothetical protein
LCALPGASGPPGGTSSLAGDPDQALSLHSDQKILPSGLEVKGAGVGVRGEHRRLLFWVGEMEAGSAPGSYGLAENERVISVMKFAFIVSSQVASTTQTVRRERAASNGSQGESFPSLLVRSVIALTTKAT